MAMLDAPGDHFMALIKFSSGIERLRHRVVVAFLTIMERIGWRATTIRRTNRGSTRKNMKRAGGYCITTLLGAFNISVSNSSTVSMSNISRQFEIAIHVASDTRPDDSNDRFKEILYIDCAPISISYDFPLIEKCFHDKRWKIVGRKLSRVSTYILRYTGLMLRYRMWNIFMVSP